MDTYGFQRHAHLRLVDIHEVEDEDHAQLAGAGADRPQDLALVADAGHLADRDGVVPAEDLAVHLAQVLVQPRAVGEVLEPGLVLLARQRDVGVRVPGRLGDQVDDVHAEARRPPPHPEVHHVPDGGAHVGVLPVQVRLLGREEPEVELARPLVVVPGRVGLAQDLRPVVGGLGRPVLVGAPRRLPDVPVALGATPAAPALAEPRVLVAGVVHDQVHHQLHAALAQLRDQLVHVVQRAVALVDLLVVRDVVPHVRLRRLEDRRGPQHVDAQRLEVVEPRGDALD